MLRGGVELAQTLFGFRKSGLRVDVPRIEFDRPGQSSSGVSVLLQAVVRNAERQQRQCAVRFELLRRLQCARRRSGSRRRATAQPRGDSDTASRLGTCASALRVSPPPGLARRRRGTSGQRRSAPLPSWAPALRALRRDIQRARRIAVLRLQAREQQHGLNGTKSFGRISEQPLRFDTTPGRQLLLRSLKRCRTRLLLRSGARRALVPRAVRSWPSSPASCPSAA